MPTCFLVRFAGAPDPDDTPTRLFLLTVFQLLLTGRYHGKEGGRGKPQANISFLRTDSTYVGYSGAAGVEYVFPSWFFLIPNLSVLFNISFLSMVTLHKQFPCKMQTCHKYALQMQRITHPRGDSSGASW